MPTPQEEFDAFKAATEAQIAEADELRRLPKDERPPLGPRTYSEEIKHLQNTIEWERLAIETSSGVSFSAGE